MVLITNGSNLHKSLGCVTWLKYSMKLSEQTKSILLGKPEVLTLHSSWNTDLASTTADIQLRANGRVLSLTASNRRDHMNLNSYGYFSRRMFHHRP